MNAGTVRHLVVVLVAAVWAIWVSSHAFTIPGTLTTSLIDHPLDSFPHWREALWRASRGVGGAVIVLLGAWQLGRLCLRRVPFEHGLEAMLFALAVGVVALDSILLLLARAGAYRPVPWMRTEMTVRRRSTHDRVCLAIAAAALAYSAIAALAPETEYDALWYHIWLPREWLLQGRLSDPAGEYIGLNPGGWELLNGAAMVLGGPVAARLLHFACLPLGALAACALARWCARRVSVPLVVVAVARRAAGGARHWLWLGIVVAGSALGIKHLGLVVLALAACALFVVEARHRRPGAAAGVAALFVAGAVALALPWYGRAYAASGNPLYEDAHVVLYRLVLPAAGSESGRADR